MANFEKPSLKVLLEQGIGKKGAEVQASTFVILFGFGAKSKLTVFKFPFFANTRPLCAILRRLTT
jgi:hypothetical protein